MRSASYSKVHTAGNAVPPVGGELAGVLEDLSGIHAAIDMFRAGVRLLATERLTRDETQTILAALGGADGTDVVGMICALIARLVDADTNPALRDMDLAAQANLRRMGEAIVVDAATSFPRDLVAETCARIDPYAQFDDVDDLFAVDETETDEPEPVRMPDPALIPGPSKIRESSVTGITGGIVVRVDLLDWNESTARVRIEDCGIHLRQGEIHAVPLAALMHIDDYAG